MGRAQESQSTGAPTSDVETPHADERNLWIIRTGWNTPFSTFQNLVQKLPADGTLLTPELVPWQTYRTLLSDVEVEEVKNNPIVLNVKIDQGGQAFDLEQELKAGLRRGLREALKAIVGARSSGISPDARKFISGHLEKGTGQFLWEGLSENDLDMVHSEIGVWAGYGGFLNRLWKNDWYGTRNSTITYLLSGI